MSRPPRSPGEAADLHLRLVREFKTVWFRNYMQGFWETYYDSNKDTAPIGSIDHKTGQVKSITKPSEYAWQLFGNLSLLVNESQTVFVTDDICHVVSTMAKSMPEDMLLPDDVPFDNMMIFFERDFGYDEWQGDHWKSTPIRAVQIAKNQPVRSWGGEPKRGVMITLLTAVDHFTPEANNGDLVVVDMTGWQFERMWSAANTDQPVDQQEQAWDPDENPDLEQPQPHTISQNVASMRKFLLCLLRFMQEEIIQVSRERMSRAQKRRAAREEGFHIPEDGSIVIVHLRKVRYIGPTEHTDTPVQWTHRWWSSGHVRHLDYLEPGRTTWVRPCIKGPEWLPIVMKERIIDVDR